MIGKTKTEREEHRLSSAQQAEEIEKLDAGFSDLASLLSFRGLEEKRAANRSEDAEDKLYNRTMRELARGTAPSLTQLVGGWCV